MDWGTDLFLRTIAMVNLRSDLAGGGPAVRSASLCPDIYAVSCAAKTPGCREYSTRIYTHGVRGWTWVQSTLACCLSIVYTAMAIPRWEAIKRGS